MSKKKTHEEYVEELTIKNQNIEVVEQYIGAKIPILHRCIIHNVIWSTTPDRALRGVCCPKCKSEQLSKCRHKTHEQYVTEVSLLNPNVVVIGKYVGANTPIEHCCKKHNVLWNAYPESILRGGGCQKCGKEKIGERLSKTHAQYVEETLNINPYVEVIDEYVDSKTAILHRCKKHNILWYAYPTNILRNHGCPQCCESYGEKQVCQWLSSHDIEYIPQHQFDDCKNQRVLPFDFYLPTYNVCIEYDGEQHYRPVEFFGGELGFQQRQRNDAIKTKYCENNGIRLLRIPYFKNVEEELENFLFI